jgi:uncharacterized protein (TIGR03435 family)
MEALMRRCLSVAAPVVAALATLHAQSFEVASIKPNRSGSQSSTLNIQPGGRWNGVNVTAQMLILRAYRIQPSQLIGAPDWAATERFDVVAMAAAGTPQEQMPLMVRALLADRFKLAVHQESRDLPIYALVARATAALGRASSRRRLRTARLCLLPVPAISRRARCR